MWKWIDELRRLYGKPILRPWQVAIKVRENASKIGIELSKRKTVNNSVSRKRYDRLYILKRAQPAANVKAMSVEASNCCERLDMSEAYLRLHVRSAERKPSIARQ